MEQAKFPYSSLGKALWKQITTIYYQGRKQIEALKVLKPIEPKLRIKDAVPIDQLNEETKNKIEGTLIIEKNCKKIFLIFLIFYHLYPFQTDHAVSYFLTGPFFLVQFYFCSPFYLQFYLKFSTWNI